ncbi:Hypothetical protein NTJ_09864 [Nesidiocoris tenuis]|uniref:Uncharacterized protein n=1 Tax=Nesidiocoris tenuis TaxID=355587 RepID=A0ABN7AXZ4_9HEMI|nr:Hypothetical protein NTJ_09864 [Nesidiocoris tenuis]
MKSNHDMDCRSCLCLTVTHNGDETTLCSSSVDSLRRSDAEHLLGNLPETHRPAEIKRTRQQSLMRSTGLTYHEKLDLQS